MLPIYMEQLPNIARLGTAVKSLVSSYRIGELTSSRLIMKAISQYSVLHEMAT
jgi:hypothetical protein